MKIALNAKDFMQTRIALIGSLYGGVQDVAILENDCLIILMNTILTVIDCRTLAMKFHKRISDFGIYFSIYEFENAILYMENWIY